MSALALPRVILIGDSIRKGYESTARECLAGAAEVWTPDDNCRWTTYTLEHLDEWVISRQPDVVHMNWGLHDCVLIGDDRTLRMTPAEYQANLRTLFDRISSETSAKLIFATTTPVIAARQQSGSYGRVVRRDESPGQFNDAARAVLADYDIALNDLYQVIIDAGKDEMVRDDGVHFTDEGSVVLGRAVADAIKAVL
jgi:lysophospholipase L1-like esterase